MTKQIFRSFLLKVRQIWNDFFKPKFLPKNKRTNSFLLLVDLFLFVLWPKSQATKISRRFSVGCTRDAKVILRNPLRNYRSIKDLLQDQNTLTGCSVLCSLSVNIFSGDQQCGLWINLLFYIVTFVQTDAITIKQVASTSMSMSLKNWSIFILSASLGMQEPTIINILFYSHRCSKCTMIVWSLIFYNT